MYNSRWDSVLLSVGYCSVLLNALFCFFVKNSINKADIVHGRFCEELNEARLAETDC